MFNSLKRKKFEDSDNDDDDDIDPFDDKKKKARNSNKVIIKHSFKDSKASQDKKISILEDSDDNVSIIDSKSNSPITINNIEKEAELEVQRLLKSFTAEAANNVKPDIPTTTDNINSKKTDEIDKLLNDLRMKKVR